MAQTVLAWALLGQSAAQVAQRARFLVSALRVRNASLRARFHTGFASVKRMVSLMAQNQLLVALKTPAEPVSGKHEANFRVRRFLAKPLEEFVPEPFMCR